MSTPEIPVMNPEEKKPTAPRNWKNRSRIWGIPVATLAIWAALFLVACALPALPVPGMTGMITIGAIMSAISGMVLGPAAAIGNAAGGLISILLFPYGFNVAGVFSFIPAMIGGLVGGLLFTNKWAWAGIIELLVIGSWFVNPKAWQPMMWIVPLPFSAIALLVIFIGPLRNWVRRKILELDKVWMWPAVALMVIVTHSAEFLTTNSMTNWIMNLSWQYWVPTWLYWVGVDAVIIVIATFIGVGIMTGLRKARLTHIVDVMEK